MKRQALIALFALALAALALGCASDSKATASGGGGGGGGMTAVGDAGALAGSWAAGQTKVSFEGANYTWEEVRPCGAPPCPVTTKSGTFEVRRGQVYLTPAGGTVEVFEAKIGTSPRALWLKSTKSGTELNLN